MRKIENKQLVKYAKNFDEWNTNQKVPAMSRDHLMRRPAESNRIPLNRTSRLSDGDQNHLISTSPYLRTLYSKVFRNKNNTSISEDAVSGPISRDATPPDKQEQYSTNANTVNRLIHTRLERNMLLSRPL
jgi:hypothetical protein